MDLKIFTILSAAFVCYTGAAESYEEWFVLKVNVTTPFQMQMLQQYVDMGAHQFFDSLSLKKPALVAVRNWNVEGFYKNVEEYLCADVDTISENLQEWFDEELIATPQEPMTWTRFQNIEQIYDYLQHWPEELPDLVSTFTIGRSYQGREIIGVKVERNPRNPSIFIESNMNGREWLTSAVSTWFLNELLISEDPKVINLRENINWYFLVLPNPDGFNHSHREDRMWGKTRKPNTEWCIGTNPDRNFPYFWNKGGASNGPCSIEYAGSEELSEIETIALANWVNKNARRFTAYFNLHGTNQRLMYPFATKNAPGIRNEEEHVRVGEAMVDAMEKRYGTKYEFGNVLNSVYEASGSSVDWVKGVHDIPFVWQHELRSENTGFVVHAEKIIEVAEEFLDGILTFVEEAQKLDYFKAEGKASR